MASVEDLRRELELTRLADELETSAEHLDGVSGIDADELAHLRRQFAAGLVARHEAVFDGFAQAAGLVPATLAATVTRKVIGPSLAGRMAGAMGPRRAAAIMSHLDTGFLADACRTLSPDAAAQLLPAIDDQQVTATVAELAGRDDHGTLGRFVDAVDDRRLRMVLEVLDAPRHLLLAGAATDTSLGLDRVVRLLTPGRRLGIVQAAPAHPDAAANILVRLSPESRGLLLDAVTDLGDRELVALLDDLAGAMQSSAILRVAAGSLPGPELALAARALDRGDEVERALGRLAMTVITETT